MGKTNDFFKEKKPWSKIKDDILSWYLQPYITKILATHRPLLIIDCFAGKGKFDDGNEGSPLIILRNVKNTSSKYGDAKIYCAFIEKKYYKDLEDTVNAYSISSMSTKIKVLKGTFEENIDNLLLKLDKNFNVFFYVDPYGHKSLNFDRFQLIKSKGFNSVEMLINFNTFGFLREGCRLLKIREDETVFAAYDDYETDETNDLENMNSIANGNYWISILNDYQKGKITIHEAEECFIASYINRFKILFKYIINIPIKLKIKNMPKYRLVFGTDYPDGILLMADKMSKVWEEMVLKDREGQLSLFNFDYPAGFAREKTRNIIMAELKSIGNHVELKNFLCLLIGKYGLPMAPRIVKSELKKMEQIGIIEVKRAPPFTKKTGKPTMTFDYYKYNIKVRIKP